MQYNSNFKVFFVIFLIGIALIIELWTIVHKV